MSRFEVLLLDQTILPELQTLAVEVGTRTSKRVSDVQISIIGICSIVSYASGLDLKEVCHARLCTE